MNEKAAADQARTYNVEIDDADEKEKIIRVAGRLSLTNGHLVHRDILLALRRSPHQSLTLDLSGVTYMDSAAVAVVLDVERLCRAEEVEFTLTGLSGDVEGLLGLVDRHQLTKVVLAHRPRSSNLAVQIGEGTLALLEDARRMFIFVGDATLAMLKSVAHPGQVRWREVLYYMERAGADALPIVGLISLLMGLILGFQAIMQLKQFGANVFTADLVGLSVLRELGPLMTCILVAGRSGSAFAAEIGTMKVSEEVDALITMGFEPMRFLVVPKIIALVAMVPLLTVYADFLGLVGGLIVGTTLGDVTISAYVQESYKTIDLWDIGQGLIKAEAFGIIVALVGCLRGFQVKGGAASVGLYTTSAVVSGIFLIIIVDSVFTLIFQYFG